MTSCGALRPSPFALTARLRPRVGGSAMKRPVFIARQSARPSGLVGRVIAAIMARETAGLNEEAVSLLQPSPSDWVLEIGFGHGRTIERLARVAVDGRACGLDVSEAMLAVAARRNRRAIAEGRVELRMGDCASLPFDNSRFDRAIRSHPLFLERSCFVPQGNSPRPSTGGPVRARISPRRQPQANAVSSRGLRLLRRA